MSPASIIGRPFRRHIKMEIALLTSGVVFIIWSAHEPSCNSPPLCFFVKGWDFYGVKLTDAIRPVDCLTLIYGRMIIRVHPMSSNSVRLGYSIDLGRQPRPHRYLLHLADSSPYSLIATFRPAQGAGWWWIQSQRLLGDGYQSSLRCGVILAYCVFHHPSSDHSPSQHQRAR